MYVHARMLANEQIWGYMSFSLQYVLNFFAELLDSNSRSMLLCSVICRALIGWLDIVVCVTWFSSRSRACIHSLIFPHSANAAASPHSFSELSACLS